MWQDPSFRAGKQTATGAFPSPALRLGQSLVTLWGDFLHQQRGKNSVPEPKRGPEDGPPIHIHSKGGGVGVGRGRAVPGPSGS